MQTFEDMSLNKALRYFIIGGVFFIPFISIIVWGTMFFPFITAKNFAFRVVVELIVAAWIILAMRESFARPRFSWMYGTLAIFLFVITLADILGPNFFRSFWSNYERMEGLVTHFHLFAYFLVAVSVLKKEELWERFFHISLGVALFLGLYGVLQLAHGIVINQGGVRVDGTFGNATYFAVYMLFHVMLGLFFWLRGKTLNYANIFYSGFVGFGLFILFSGLRMANALVQTGSAEKLLFVFAFFAIAALAYLLIQHRSNVWVRHVLYGLLSLFFLFMLYKTETRGAMLGFIGGTSLAALLYVLFGKIGKRGRSIGVGVLTLFVILVGGFWALRHTDFVQNNQTLNRFTNITYESGRSRFLIWNMSLKGFEERPILGWGQDNFPLVFNKYYDARMYDQEPWFDRSHNIFFDWLVAGGILGLLAYLLIYISTIYYLWFYKKGAAIWNERERVLLTGLIAAYFFQNIFVFDNITSYLIFFSILAFIHSRACAHTEDATIADTRRRSRESALADQIIATVVVLGLIFVFYASVYKGYIQNKELLLAIAPQQNLETNLEHFKNALSYRSFGEVETREQLTQFAISITGNQNSTSDLRQRVFNVAKEEMTSQVESVPQDARYRLFLATLYNTYHLYDEALVQLEKAREASPQKQIIYFATANVYAQKTDFKEALLAAKKGYELEPKNIEGLKIYASAAIYAGQYDFARELLKPLYNNSTDADDPMADPVLVNALVARKQFGIVARIWEKKVQKNPSDSQSHLSLAAAYLELGKKDMAIQEIKRAIELNPGFKEQGEYYIQQIKAGRNP